MDPVSGRTDASAPSPTAGRSRCHTAAAHGVADLSTDAGLEPDCDADTNADAHDHAGAQVEPDGYSLKDADSDAYGNGRGDRLAHAYGDGVSNAETDSVPHAHHDADAQPDTTAHRSNVVSAQQPLATGGRHELSPHPPNGLRPTDGICSLQLRHRSRQ
jgi:hypothetical protein